MIQLNEGGPAYAVFRAGLFQIRGAETKEDLTEDEEKFQNVLSEIDVVVRVRGEGLFH